MTRVDPPRELDSAKVLKFASSRLRWSRRGRREAALCHASFEYEGLYWRDVTEL